MGQTINTQEPTLARFNDAIADLYGDNLSRVVLFGSRARGDNEENRGAENEIQ
jgi:hypothetical protein